MATLSCYSAQVLIVAMLMAFAVFSAVRTWPFTALACVVMAMLVIAGWDCRYTMVCG